jgi:hypothetical protein
MVAVKNPVNYIINFIFSRSRKIFHLVYFAAKGLSWLPMWLGQAVSRGVAAGGQVERLATPPTWGG